MLNSNRLLLNDLNELSDPILFEMKELRHHLWSPDLANSMLCVNFVDTMDANGLLNVWNSCK